MNDSQTDFDLLSLELLERDKRIIYLESLCEEAAEAIGFYSPQCAVHPLQIKDLLLRLRKAGLKE